eukprot:13158-Heterococcus_DN1.PRE.2
MPSIYEVCYNDMAAALRADTVTTTFTRLHESNSDQYKKFMHVTCQQCTTVCTTSTITATTAIAATAAAAVAVVTMA